MYLLSPQSHQTFASHNPFAASPVDFPVRQRLFAEVRSPSECNLPSDVLNPVFPSCCLDLFVYVSYLLPLLWYQYKTEYSDFPNLHLYVSFQVFAYPKVRRFSFADLQ